MHSIRIFISSVQSEFTDIRQQLCHYISTDALLGKFFVPVIFEQLPAQNQTAQRAYIEEVHHCDIYIGILGQQYGNVTVGSVSATELEYNEATRLYKHRLIFITNHIDIERDERQLSFIKRVGRR